MATADGNQSRFKALSRQKHARTISRKRQEKASATLDLVAVFVILVPLALLAVNVGFLVLGSYINDAACREAARVAATQSSVSNAYAAAAGAVQTFAVGKTVLGSPQVSSVNFNFSLDKKTKLPIEVINLSSTNLSKAPCVEVSTNLIEQTPAPLLFNGNTLASQVVLTSTYTFPILYGIDPSPNSTPNDTGTDSSQNLGSEPNDPPDQVSND